MQFDSESESMRNFGYCIIEWKIENFFSATSTEHWIIGSPMFTINGKNATKWRLFLNKQADCIENKSTVVASLTKCDSLQEPIWVNWKLFLPCDVGASEFEVEYDFKDENYFDIEICSVSELEKIMQYSTEDILAIRSVIFVSSNKSQIYKRPKDLGLKSLVQDMTVYYNVGRKRDLKLLIGGLKAEAHKGILCCRNDVLKRTVERDTFVTTLPELDVEAVEAVFRYLYTGNLDYVLRKPSLSLLECIRYFDIKDVENYYEPDEVELCSEYKMKRYKFESAIAVQKISDSNIIIRSSNILNDFSYSEHSFPLQFNLESAIGTEMSDYVSVYFEDMEKSLPKTAYVEISIMNVNGTSEYLQRKRFVSNVAFQNFLPRDILNDFSFTSDGKLHLLCCFYSPMSNSRQLSVVNKTIHSEIIIDCERHYEMLSNQMAALFESGLYSDLTLTSEGQDFPVHTSILSVRSHIFKELFKSRRDRNMRAFEITCMKNDILRIVLYYIYSGKLANFEITQLLDIYEAAERLYILPLKQTCVKILLDNVDSLDINRALYLAESFKDYKLLFSLRKFITEKNSCCLQSDAETSVNI